MKRKLGKSLCSMLLALAMVIGLMPGMSLTAKADNTETLLTTITPKTQTTYEETPSEIFTVIQNCDSFSENYGWLWHSSSGTLKVLGREGYTITKVIFKQNEKTPVTVSSAPFELHFVWLDEFTVGCQENNDMDGVTSIEVYGYAPVQTYTVTYSVVNGTWSDGTTADKTETVQSGSAPASVPSGMIAGSGFTGGSWDTDPASATITGDTKFTYTFEAIPTYTVTYRVVNGTWSDGTTADITESVQSGSSPASVPSGMIANSGYTGGSWDTDPSSATITGNITFTYTFEAESVDPDPVTPTPDPDPVATVSMYRLYNPNSGEHFYTANAGERNHLIGLGWNDEGIGWTAPARSNTPVYRLYNQNGGEHHFTTSVAERNNLIGLGWNDEGIGWYSDDARTVSVYRQYNPNAFANNHNFTTSSAENDHLVSLGWRAEGIGWYGV